MSATGEARAEEITAAIMADMNRYGDWRDFNEHPGNVPSLESCVEGYAPSSPAGLAMRRAELAQLRADAAELVALRAALAAWDEEEGRGD